MANNHVQNIVDKRQDSQCGVTTCNRYETCYTDTYYYIPRCSSTAISVSASTETATATFTVTTTPTYSISSTSTSTASNTSTTASSSPALTSSTPSPMRPSIPPSSTTTTSTSTPASSSSGLSTGVQAAIGGSVAGAAIGIFCILLFIYIRRYRRKRHTANGKSPSDPGNPDGDIEDIPGGGELIQIHPRELTQAERDQRRREADEERAPARYERRRGENPWARSGDLLARPRDIWRDSARWDGYADEDDYNELPAGGAPFSPENVGNRGDARQPASYAVRGPHENIQPVPHPSLQHPRR